MKRVAIIAALLASAILPGCNTMEVINQSVPGYHAPIPFSHSWWNDRKVRKEFQLYHD